MNNETTRLFADFMQVTRQGELYIVNNLIPVHETRLHQHLDYEDWNNLMGVVERVEAISINFSTMYEDVIINGAGCLIEMGAYRLSVASTNKKDAVIDSLIEFIQWYNKQNKEQ